MSLERWLEQEDDDFRFKFGKHQDELLSEVMEDDPKYIHWMVWDADFEDDLVEAITDWAADYGYVI